MTHYLTLTPRDPIIARDGRPFGLNQGYRMRSLDWPYPSVLAGSLRTWLGGLAGGNFDSELVTALKSISIAGPFPEIDGELYFPAPRDLTADCAKGRAEGLQIHAARPKGLLPGQGVFPAAPVEPIEWGLGDADDDFKPMKGPAFFSSGKMANWLCDPRGTSFRKVIDCDRPEDDWGKGFLDSVAKDARMHVAIDGATYAARDGELFLTVALDCSRDAQSTPVRLAVRAETEGHLVEHLQSGDSLHPMGGERRLLHWNSSGLGADAWQCPDAVREALRSAPRIRMVLATPGLFGAGWHPDWLQPVEGKLVGTPPGLENSQLRLRLRGAVLDRWKPLSGWSLERGKVGPKPVRRLVPAGSVYFFDVVNGDSAQLEQLWLRSVCDDAQDRRDGFGVALWGVWDH